MSETLEQRRAKHAWAAVLRAKLGTDKKYGGQAKKLPMRIMASGLGQALAFLKAKGYAPKLLEDVGDWVLVQRSGNAAGARTSSDSELLLRIVNGNSDFLRRATDETLAYLQWLNRFAEAEGLAGDGD